MLYFSDFWIFIEKSCRWSSFANLLFFYKLVSYKEVADKCFLIRGKLYLWLRVIGTYMGCTYIRKWLTFCFRSLFTRRVWQHSSKLSVRQNVGNLLQASTKRWNINEQNCEVVSITGLGSAWKGLSVSRESVLAHG